MADYLVTDTELTSVADAIRTKGGTSEQLVFPTGFTTAIANISGGGDDLNIQTYTKYVDGYSFTAKEIKGNCSSVPSSTISSNAVIISTEFFPTSGTNSAFIYPLTTRDTDGIVHIGLMNTSNSAASGIYGNLIIKYYVEGE